MTEQEVKEKFDELYTKYQHTMELLVESLDKIESLEKQLDKKPKEVIVEVEKEVKVEVEIEVPVEVIKEVIVEKEIEVEVEKVVEVQVPVEVEKETVVTVEKEVPGPERIVEVPGPERRVEVPGPERIVEKINPADKKLKQKNLVLSAEIEQLKQQKQEVKEVIVEVPVTEFVETAPEVIEKESSKDLHEAARLMAQSEFNREDLSEQQIYKILIKESEDEVKKKIGFWAMPLPTDDKAPTNKKYTGKKR